MAAAKGAVVRKNLLFGPLGREHAMARLLCVANSEKLQAPLITDFRLNVRCKLIVRYFQD